MDIVNLIQFLFIFLPGIACVILVNYAILDDAKLDFNRGVAYSFIVGVLCYLPLNLFDKGETLKTLLSKNPRISPAEISLALLFVIPYSLFFTWVINGEKYHYFLRKLRLSNKLGKKYLAQGLISSKDESFESIKQCWVSIRYQNKEQVYIGSLQALNIIEQGYFEILLKDVSAYFDNKDIPSYELEAIYLYERPENIVIEYHKK
ncbi:MAG: hypothetical protein SOR11_07485 [Fusobacterium sp.]|uniref:hypothetical protein n=1 Tax=Fusobacterium sp. TaxID=68766 RepID=UPI002A74ECD5|nr:hypothetical protein [Fusobacterium sp.]MCF2639411.1 hypothetical protein [Fusobacterium varium]MDY3059824.1 hypothetical protein [Fusobacterium sp.]